MVSEAAEDNESTSVFAAPVEGKKPLSKGGGQLLGVGLYTGDED